MCNVATGYISPNGYHRHKCSWCGTIWEHSDDKAGDNKAHKCPKCNMEEWYKYTGSSAPCYSMVCNKIIPKVMSNV